MIISKTPLRVPFFSGSSDLPAFYEKEMGAAISATIDKYVYVSVHRPTDDEAIVNGKKYDWKNDGFKDIDPITRTILNYYGLIGRISINSWSDINHRGTGLGASSAYAVGLIHACHYLRNFHSPSPEFLAHAACDVEINRCKFPIGKQDQHAAAFGGFNMFYFHTDGITSIKRLELPNRFSDNFYLLNTGIERDSKDTIAKEINMDSARKGRDYAYRMLDILCKPGHRLDDIGALFDDAWMNKKEGNPNASTTIIDKIYNTLTSASSEHWPRVGGKVLGAGGGGFMLFYVARHNQVPFYQKVKELPYGTKHMPFNFIEKGSEIIYSDK